MIMDCVLHNHMSKQLHKRFSNEQVKSILAKYTHKEITAKQAITYLEIGRTRFYQLVQSYQDDPLHFSIEYQRLEPTRRLVFSVEQNILKELQTEKEKIIDNPDVPTKQYNYSYIKQQLQRKYKQNPALSTIINRAKQHGYWKKKPPKRIHDREILTNFIGELIQHDSSHHLFAPDSSKKWYLITSLDDHSRTILYADFLERESTWNHIMALQSVFLTYGFPLQYYVDQHSIFRYVKDRDKQSPWYTNKKFTDDVDPQWKQVIKDCGVKPIYALSPQAKGKVERPYQWLQDHIVRTCVREGITQISDGRKVLQDEIAQYNYKRVHSTTGEIPMIRFRKAIKEQKSLFREFKLEHPFKSAKDVFCLRFERRVDSYRKVSLKGLSIQVPKVMPRQKVELRLYPDFKTGLTEIRFWHNQLFVGSQQVKNQDLPIIHF